MANEPSSKASPAPPAAEPAPAAEAASPSAAITSAAATAPEAPAAEATATEATAAEAPASPALPTAPAVAEATVAAEPTIATELEVEVDANLTDSDSALGDEGSTYTSSLASSVVDYPVEYGRRYHAYQHGRYVRPNDELEMDRLLIMHTAVTTAIGGLFRAPVDMEKPQRVLDIGTGNGVWAIELADQYPNAQIIGNDLSANMPTFVPPNVKFEVDDVESEWMYEQKFTFIFSRYMAASIADWPKLMQRSYDNLEPGGWVEFQDWNFIYYSEDNSLHDDDALMVWVKLLYDTARKVGREPGPGPLLLGWVQDAGFVNVVHKKVKIPIGTWPKDPHLKEVGMHSYMQLVQGLEGFSLRLLTGVLKWKVEEALVLLADVRKCLQNPNCHPIMDLHVVYGQKPL